METMKQALLNSGIISLEYVALVEQREQEEEDLRQTKEQVRRELKRQEEKEERARVQKIRKQAAEVYASANGKYVQGVTARLYAEKKRKESHG